MFYICQLYFHYLYMPAVFPLFYKCQLYLHCSTMPAVFTLFYICHLNLHCSTYASCIYIVLHIPVETMELQLAYMPVVTPLFYRCKLYLHCFMLTYYILMSLQVWNAEFEFVSEYLYSSWTNLYCSLSCLSLKLNLFGDCFYKGSQNFKIPIYLQQYM